MRVTIGADPEFFVSKGGVHVPAVGLVPGTKDKPHPLRRGAVQLDGTAVEFNITPCVTALGFTNAIKRTLRDVRGIVPLEYNFEFTPAIHYDRKLFDALPEESKVLGCDPDFNAYKNGEANPRPDNNTTMRTAAGHIHIGWGKDFNVKDKSHIWDCCEITKLLDGYFYPYSKIWDTDEDRANMYGAIGAFRPKSYGLEYRVLSCAWLKYPKLWPWIHKSCKGIMQVVEQGDKINDAYIAPEYYARVMKNSRDLFKETDAQLAAYHNRRMHMAFNGNTPAFPADYAT